MSEPEKFSETQQSYLQGFAIGADVARIVRGLPILSGSVGNDQKSPFGAAATCTRYTGPEGIHYEAQDRLISAGRNLSGEETAKRQKNPLDMWDEMRQRAAAAEFPAGSDVFLTKFQGMFYVAPAQDSYMCRLRIPGGVLSAFQFIGLADLAERYAGGFSDVTTRANLQFREIGPADPIHVLTGLRDLGLINLGSGGDNIRNVTASPLSGIDPAEFIETLPLAKEMHHYILAHREMYGLPRKFNIAFEGGGTIASLQDTNDIGFQAISVDEANATESFPAGVYFRLQLGGITGHHDFARDTGVVVRPEQCVPVAAPIVRVFIMHGDRTDRKKARLKYLLDDWGFEKFLKAVEDEFGGRLARLGNQHGSEPTAEDRFAHVVFHSQKQPGFHYVGVVLPVGRLTVEQMRGLAAISQTYGNGEIRLTVWQNVLIPGIPASDIDAVKREIEAIGLDWRARNLRSGLVACTGNAGCKFAASDTKRQAMRLATYLDERLELDQPVNIHLTGCHHSCAQHYIGDIGLLATAVDVNDELVEGYHIFVGGGWGIQQGIARELFPSVAFDDIPPLLEQTLVAYLTHRENAAESFAGFARRHEIDALRTLIESTASASAGELTNA